MTEAPAPLQAAAVRPPRTPYVGLVPYSEEDAAFFFGRDEKKEIVTGNLRAARLTILYGASGVGKTSLLQAGVIHDLREQARAQAARRPERAPFAICAFSSWRDDPLPALAEAIRASAVEALGGNELAHWRPGESLVDVVHGWTERVRTLLVVLDQFEDYFLYHPDESGDGGFAAEFPLLVNAPNLRVNFLLAIREDAWAKLDRFEGSIPALFSNYIRVEHLDRKAAREAIEGPVGEWNRRLPPGKEPYEIEPALVEAVIEAAASAGGLGPAESREHSGPEASSRDAVEAPFLQLVLERLWRATVEAGARTLDLSRLEALGGAQRIVENHLREALAALTPREQAVAADLFRFLVTRSKAKIAHPASDLAEWTKRPEPEVAAVLDKLCRGESGRILRPLSPSAGMSRTLRYELFHDVLAEPILEWRRGYQRRLDRRRFALVGAGLIAIVAVFAALGVWALVQRSEAREQARLARSRELAANAVSQLGTDPELSLALALRAGRLDATPQAEDALRQALIASRVRAVLRGATGAVTAAGFSPDGRTIVTSSADGSARIYSADGRLLHVLRHGSPLHMASFSPSGKLVLTVGDGPITRIWNARSGAQLLAIRTSDSPTAAAFSPDDSLVVVCSGQRASLRSASTGKDVADLPQPSAVTSVAFAPGGATVVVGGADGTARLWRARDHHLLFVLRAGGRVRSVAFSPNGTVVMTALFSSVRLWKTTTGAPLRTLFDLKSVHAAVAGSTSGADEQTHVAQAAFSPNGKSLVTSSDDGGVRVYDVATGRRTALFFGHTGYANAAAFSADGKWVVTASNDRTARIWQAASGEPGLVLVGHGDSVNTAVFSADGSRVVTASNDGTARIWDPGILPTLQLLSSQAGEVNGVALSPDGRLAVSAGADGTARIWRLADRRQLRVLHQGGNVTVASFSLDGTRVLSAGTDGTARLWDPASGLLLRQFPAGTPLSSAAFSSDGALVAAGGADGVVRVWRIGGARLLQLKLGAAVLTTSFSPDGTKLLAAGKHGLVRLWSVRDGAVLHDLRGHQGAVVRASFSPDGSVVVSAGADATARIWRVSDGLPLHLLTGHVAALTDAEFSRDGSQLVTTSLDHDARIWDVATGMLVHVLRGHFALVNGAAFSPDGRWVVTAGPGTAGLWPTASGTLLEYLRGPTAPLTSALFTPDGRTIVTASRDGSVRVFDCQICGTTTQLVAFAEERLAATGRTLTPEERARFLHG